MIQIGVCFDKVEVRFWIRRNQDREGIKMERATFHGEFPGWASHYVCYAVIKGYIL